MERPDPNGAKLIPLTRNQYVIVDTNIYEYLNQWRWRACIMPGIGQYIAVRQYRDPKNRAKRVFVSMANIVLPSTNGKWHDHINGNPLDNRRSNLRLVTLEQNRWNSRKHILRHRFSSNYKGVSKGYWRKKQAIQTWLATIACRRQIYRLGVFSSETEAAKAYDQKARELFGEYACTNFQ